MALNATIYRYGIDLSDMNRHVYESLSVHVALHPSETVERMCARVLAYAIHYQEGLEFTKGLSTDDEPDLWVRNYSDEIEHWIELGKPDPKRLRKALGRSKQLTVYSYGGQDVDQWLDSVKKDASVRGRISIVRLDREALDEFSGLIERTMQLGIMIQDDVVHLSFKDQMIDFKLVNLMERL